MNKTDIEYCDYSWNPATGCLNECDFCYARKLAKRFNLYGGSFKPQFHRDKLAEPRKIKNPSVIFVCDMGDIFSKGMKKSWIEEVKSAARNAPWHTYLWLTKNPRYDESWVEPNWWLGATITGRDAYQREVAEGENIWYSFEPLFGFIEEHDRWEAKQIVIGRATNYDCAWCDGWAEELTSAYQQEGTLVFWKDNIGKPGPRDLAWPLNKKGGARKPRPDIPLP